MKTLYKIIPLSFMIMLAGCAQNEQTESSAIIQNDNDTKVAVVEGDSEQAGDEKNIGNQDNKNKLYVMYNNMIGFVRDGGFPDGYVNIGSYDDASEYALSDVDNDGREELLFKMNNKSISELKLYIYECNPDEGEAHLELECFTDVDFRDDGIIIGYDSHNLGATEADWEGSIFKYNSTTDKYDEIARTTKGESGAYYPDIMEWHKMDDSIFDINPYIEEVKKNISKVSADDVLYDLLECDGLYGLINYYQSNNKYGIEQVGNGDELFFSAKSDDKEVLNIEAYEGGVVSYNTKQICGLTIAGIYPGMNVNEARDVLSKINLIHKADTDMYYTGFYGSKAYSIYIKSDNDIVTDVCLSEHYYLEWEMLYDNATDGDSNINDSNDENIISDNDNISVSYIETSSSLTDEYGNYCAENLIDGSYNTAWADGVSGNGVGETITIHFNGVQILNGIDIVNGYTKNWDTYFKNGRVTLLKIDYGDGRAYDYGIQYIDESDTVAQSDIVETCINRFDFEETIATDSVTITIMDAVAGSKYNDTCISEIMFR